MTHRLYYTDSYQTTFTASIVDRLHVNGKPAVILEHTAFYPTSGGQPHDTGTLGDRRVLDVMAEADGPVVHVLETELDAAGGGEVTGEIDWPRRYDHMQQHSGQHLLSHIFRELFGFDTVSVHFGAEESTLDLATGALADGDLDAAERRANELVYANLPVKAYFVDDEELARLPLRRPPQVDEKIRIVEIQEIDYAACGGTHCRRTGEVGPIKLLRQERSRGNVRVTFLCGWRALHDYDAKHELILDAAARFSTDLHSVPAAIEKLQEAERSLQREVAALADRLVRYEADALLAAAPEQDGYRVITHLFADERPEMVKQVAQLLQRQPSVIALLGAVSGDQLTLFGARGEDVSLHMGRLIQDTLREFGGGGGGRPEMAQGGGVAAAAADAVFSRAWEQVRAELEL
jgi:alanyl-tRNA synthetase